MKKIIAAAAIGLFLSTNAMASDLIQVKEGIGSVYNINNREEQYHNLAKTAEKEDAWLCVEDKCYDMGCGEEEKSVELNLEYILDVLKEYPDQEKALWAHIHPEKFHTSDRIHFVSVDDIISHAKMKRKIRNDLGIKLEAEVYDGKGFWKFDVTDKLESEILLKTETIHGTHYPHQFILTVQLSQIEKDLLQKNLPREQEIEEIIKKSLEKGVILSYQPME